MNARTLLHKSITLGTAVLFISLSSTAIAGDEIEDRGPYYEDDAWYDISEWFDGNDYNPTDETIGRIDDEVYQSAHDTGSDTDNDVWFGYDSRYDGDNWFYDYYDDGDLWFDDSNNDGVYEFSYRYVDVDGDGLYDGWYHMFDANNDGTFERTAYYALNTPSSSTRSGSKSNWNANKGQALSNSRRQRVEGTVASTKKVAVRDTKNLCVKLRKADGSTCLVDLGPAKELDSFDVEAGDRLAVRGPMANIGDQKVLIAQSVQCNGLTEQIDRQTRTVSGQVKSTRQVNLRGNTHLIAVIETSNGKKLAVDAGPVGWNVPSINEGNTVSVSGSLVKANDRRMLIGRTITLDGQTYTINRAHGPKSSSSKKTTKSSKKN